MSVPCPEIEPEWVEATYTITTPLLPPREQIQASLDTLKDITDKIPTWTATTQLRKQGVSVHFDFPFPVDASTRQRFAKIVDQCPRMLTNALKVILAENLIEETDND